MDGNKDEALKCLLIGEKALETGDRARALKFLTKAQRLDPNLSIEELLSKIGDDESENSPIPNEDPSPDKPSSGPSLRSRFPNVSSSSSSSSSVAYTEEQISIVKHINKKKDYYEILGIEKECSVEDVRKAYRKLSLKVHPDKNKAPGAEEAFKTVSRAFKCLSNEESRKTYDLVGSEEPTYERVSTRHGAHGFNGFYEADFDADELFRNFFFGGMPRATTPFGEFRFRTGRRTAARTNTTPDSDASNVRILLQLLPILLILLLSFLPSHEPVYSLSKSYEYEHPRVTKKGVRFYVKTSTFDETYPQESPERAKLEGRVERNYFEILSQHCRAEIQRRHWGLSHQTPHCDLLKKYETGQVSS